MPVREIARLTSAIEDFNRAHPGEEYAPVRKALGDTLGQAVGLSAGGETAGEHESPGARQAREVAEAAGPAAKVKTEESKAAEQPKTWADAKSAARALFAGRETSDSAAKAEPAGVGTGAPAGGSE